jgi:hypothetical protein
MLVLLNVESKELTMLTGFRMCEKYVSKTIYTCGDYVVQDVSFTACKDMSAKGHKVITKELGSNRVKGKCGKNNSANP